MNSAALSSGSWTFLLLLLVWCWTPLFFSLVIVFFSSVASVWYFIIFYLFWSSHCVYPLLSWIWWASLGSLLTLNSLSGRLLITFSLRFLFFFLKNFTFIYLFIYFWLCWVFVSARGLSLFAASGSHSSSRCTGLSLSRPLLLRSTGSRCAGSVVVAHGLSCSAACEILPDQGSNPCPLHWQADSQPLRHQGSPIKVLLFFHLEHVLPLFLHFSWLSLLVSLH